MDPRLGWALVVLLLVAGFQAYQWKGVALSVTLIVFWLVLQFNRTLRVMKNATDLPIGYVDNARALQARLKLHMPLVSVVGFTQSLGKRSAESHGVDETYAWTDPEGRELAISFHHGRIARWYLHVPDEAPVAQPVE